MWEQILEAVNIPDAFLGDRWAWIVQGGGEVGQGEEGSTLEKL